MKNKKVKNLPPLELDLSFIENNLGKAGICSREFDKWLDRLQKAYGKKNAFRALPLLHKGIDDVYSLLEAMKYRHHKSSSSAYEYGISAITEDPTWKCFASSVLRHFPKQVKVVRPSRTPHEAIRDKCANRTFYNFIFQKQRLIEVMKPNILNQGELGRLQIQLIDAQISSLEKAYNKRSQFSEQVWNILNDYKCRQSLLQASATPSASAEANSNGLSADASLELFAGLKVEVTKTWDFAHIRNKVTANAVVGSHFKAGAGASASIGEVEYASGKIDEEGKSEAGFSEAMQLIPGVNVGVNLELAAMTGAKVTLKHELTVGQIMNMTNEAELFVGAEASATAKIGINSKSIYGDDNILAELDVGGSAFAGVKASASSKVTFKARGISAASVNVSGSFSAGIGVTAQIAGKIQASGDISFKIETGLTAGVGASTSFGSSVNPLALKVMLWDGFAHNLTTKSYQKRKNIKLDKSLNLVAISRCNEHAIASLNSLDQVYMKMAEEMWRIPADANFSSGVYHDDLSRGAVLDEAYMRSVDKNSDSGMDKDMQGIVSSAETLNKATLDNKEYLKKQSIGKRFKREAKGLLAVQPSV